MDDFKLQLEAYPRSKRSSISMLHVKTHSSAFKHLISIFYLPVVGSGTNRTDIIKT